jgi:hypothetical protein
MRVIGQSPDLLARMQTMTKTQGKSGAIDVKALVAKDEEFLRALVRAALQGVLEAEMTEALGAATVTIRIGDATTGMSHFAIQEALDGKVVDWLEKVTDEEYLVASSE